jgi:hypothetical protein
MPNNWYVRISGISLVLLAMYKRIIPLSVCLRNTPGYIFYSPIFGVAFLLFIAEIACTSDDFDILCQALKVTGLYDDMDTGSYTVYFPTDKACKKLLKVLGVSSWADVSYDTMLDVVLGYYGSTKKAMDDDTIEACNGMVHVVTKVNWP